MIPRSWVALILLLATLIGRTSQRYQTNQPRELNENLISFNAYQSPRNYNWKSWSISGRQCRFEIDGLSPPLRESLCSRWKFNRLNDHRFVVSTNRAQWGDNFQSQEPCFLRTLTLATALLPTMLSILSRDQAIRFLIEKSSHLIDDLSTCVPYG